MAYPTQKAKPRGGLAGLLAAPEPVSPLRPMGAFKPQSGYVNMGRALPSLIPYGPQPQGLEQSSRFSGGAVPSPMSLTRPPEVPTFKTQTPAGLRGGPPPVTPVHLAALATLLTGGVGGGSKAPTGATGQTAVASAPVRSGLGIGGPSPGQAAATPGARQQAGLIPQTFISAPQPSAPQPSAQQAPRSVTAALLASLAQAGRKFQAG